MCVGPFLDVQGSSRTTLPSRKEIGMVWWGQWWPEEQVKDTSGGITGQESYSWSGWGIAGGVERFVGWITRKIVTSCIGKSQTRRRTSLWKEQSSVKIWVHLSCPIDNQTEKDESQCVFSWNKTDPANIWNIKTRWKRPKGRDLGEAVNSSGVITSHCQCWSTSCFLSDPLPQCPILSPSNFLRELWWLLLFS